VRDGDRIGAWDVLHTPGHAPGHICLFDPERRTLIAGDMVANGSTILIPPEDGGDMAAYLDQLRRLDALDATTVLPAHGEPIDDPHALFAYYIKHRLMREEKVLAAWNARRAALGREPTIPEIVPTAYDDTPMHLWPIARSAAEAHIIKLRNEKRI
jgi:ribonuclease/clavin/mitogillin